MMQLMHIKRSFLLSEVRVKYTESQFVRMTQSDKAQLLEIATREERTPSDVIRRLIRRAAQELKQSNDSIVHCAAKDTGHGTDNTKRD